MKEFLRQHLAPLQAHSRPMWELMGDDDRLRLHSGVLAEDDLDFTSEPTSGWIWMTSLGPTYRCTATLTRPSC